MAGPFFLSRHSVTTDRPTCTTRSLLEERARRKSEYSKFRLREAIYIYILNECNGAGAKENLVRLVQMKAQLEACIRVEGDSPSRPLLRVKTKRCCVKLQAWNSSHHKFRLRPANDPLDCHSAYLTKPSTQQDPKRPGPRWDYTLLPSSMKQY